MTAFHVSAATARQGEWGRREGPFLYFCFYAFVLFVYAFDFVWKERKTREAGFHLLPPLPSSALEVVRFPFFSFLSLSFFFVFHFP